LLGHASGLPAWRDVGGDWDSPAFFEFLRLPGEEAVYSDLGYIALGRFLEIQLGASLQELLNRIVDLFHLDGATFLPAFAAPTRAGKQRGAIGCKVHDPNAYALGGICGHAGLFSSARVVANWGQSVLEWRANFRSPLGAVIRECWDGQAAVNPTSWRLGLDSVSPGRSSAGNYFGKQARGHLGYTGTSVWLEPQQEIVVALLTNRVHPLDLSDPEIKRFRPKFHDAVAELFFS
jgi:CubicO group peptidase (beta-lactamase class C family)